ncbi:MAG: class I SAM-dependent methyltransferase [Candidatus Hodarchaeota archaeon]
MCESSYGYEYFHRISTRLELLETAEHVKGIVAFVLDQKVNRNIKWLDVGCAYGDLTNEAFTAGIDAYGVDLSSYAILEGERKYPKLKDRLLVCACEDLFLKFKPKTFDVISVFETLEHLQNPRTCLAIVKRLLKPKGILLISTPKPGPNATKDPTHINVHNFKFWKQALLNLNFKLSYPCIFLDIAKEGNPIIRVLAKNRLLKRCYMTAKACIIKIAKERTLEIMAILKE